jgi:hypothetical protein
VFTVDLTCPGTPDNAVELKRDLDLNRAGLRDLRNSGTCTVFVGALDSDGALVADSELVLPPDGEASHYQPPEGSVSVFAVCHRACEGTAILTYDDPDLIA